PFPLTALPELEWLTEPLGKPIEWLTQWFARAAFDLSVAPAFNGSGDRTFDYVQLLLFAILGAIGALVWSAFERSETGGRDPDGFAGGAGGSAPRGMTRRRPYPPPAPAAPVGRRHSVPHPQVVYAS